MTRVNATDDPKSQVGSMSGLPRTLFLATRPMFLPAALIPVVVGSAWGVHRAHSLDPAALALAAMAMACLHAGANVINDVGDELNGADRLNHDRIAPFTGGSRFIQDGSLGLKAMAVWGVVLLLAAGGLGGVLSLTKGQGVLAFGLVGCTLALAYSLPPFSLASRGLGEVAVALGFGLPVAACVWLQSGGIGLEALLCSAITGGWTAAILIVNEVPDLAADAQAGKRTLVVRLGIKGAPSLYLSVQAVASALMLALGWLAQLPPWVVVPPLLAMLAALAATLLMAGGRAGQLAAIRITLGIHLLGGLSLAGAAFLG
ncbi:1 4-dihydroxy-2-naphthoate polyprenyltransferase [Paramagnetospirillum magnetotacticum MS-1]|uniref:1 4-dihydroxy-2-naphthoate polyprenyltransferase n=1 Tax=Paramagnetospirillum magnetotacticum MS-1 TaxID=272627 RepID=A0A0C2YSB2_PARME|nr:prenyltransferase [Paramagnetospirillum magnetotacticum]KIL98028.1 1 4-dihydroxy-2-naphthoate polyprenyltransferase [Paramagnetospirillum magnetotacticum MS-1]